MAYPRILIISNNCFSKSGSNGRTLAKLFTDWPVGMLAQFYIHNEIPDFDVCHRYFRVTDKDVVKSYIKKVQVGEEVFPVLEKQHTNDNDNITKKYSIKRTPFTSLIREWFWNRGQWKSEQFIKWVKEFEPQVVLLQAGDQSFMNKLALDISRSLKIPLLIYNSENYYFKNKNYMNGGILSDIIYPIFIRYLRKHYDETMEYAAHSFYICDALKDLYDSHFGKPSSTVYTATDIRPTASKYANNPLQISYLGNLSVGRHIPLIEIANALQEINQDYYLDVYGRIPDKIVNDAIESCTGIRYKGFISYNEVIAVMQSSDLLIHTENFSEFYTSDLQYAFSTKIADSLGSGTCLFIYAPASMAFTKYLLENKAAFVVTEKTNLRESLAKILKDKDLRQSFISSALKVVDSNHNASVNAKKFEEIISSIIRSWEVL